MKDVQVKINNILNEKQTKILPENLKAGVTCLGVEGTMEQPEPIYATTDMKTKYNIVVNNRTDYPDGITIVDDFVIIRYYGVNDDFSSRQYGLYYKGNHVVDFTMNVSRPIPDERACTVLGYDDTNIIVCTSTPQNDYSNTLAVTKINYLTGEYSNLDNKSLSHEVYYNNNGNYYNKYIMLCSGSGSTSYRVFYDYDVGTDTLIHLGTLRGTKSYMITPQYILNDDCLTLYKLQTEDNLLVTTKLNINEVVNGVTYDGSKIFIGGNIYEFNDGVGDLLASNVYMDTSTMSVFTAINDKYYLNGNTLYEFNNETNTLTNIGENYRRRGSYIYTCTQNSSDYTAYINTYEFGKDLQSSIGIKYNDNNFYFTNNTGLNSDKILEGYIAYTKTNSILNGTMPNNGDVIIEPSTEQQIKEQGYYNSLTVNAVTSEIDSNIQPENIKKDISILDVTGTMESGIDTSDATATAGDIAQDKTAYVNEEKITGTLKKLFELSYIVNNMVWTDETDLDQLRLDIPLLGDGIVTSNQTKTVVILHYDKLAEEIGLTADKIKAGKTILGITGTYTGEIDTSL